MSDPKAEPAKEKKTILVVDDEADLRDVVSEILIGEGYDVILAENGRSGLSLALKAKPQFILSDVRMPGLDGSEFFREFRKSEPAIPFILMTGDTSAMNLGSAYELGVSEFLSKPFDRDELLSALLVAEHERALGITSTHSRSETDYCRVHIEEFIFGSTLSFDIFLKIGTEKYIRVLRAGKTVSKEKIQGYQTKGVEWLYLKSDDFIKYVSLSTLLTNAAVSKPTIPKRRKLGLLKHSIENCLKDVDRSTLSAQKLGSAQAFLETTLELITQNEDMFSLLEALHNHHDGTYSHALSVAVVSVGVAHEWGWRNSSILLRVAMAGLLHDIGKKEIPVSILEKSRAQRTPEENRIYESHPTRGRDIVSEIPGVPSEVIAVVYQHHERAEGAGYPNALHRMKIHPVARLVGTIEEFAELVFPDSNRDALTPADALARLWTLNRFDLDPHVLKGLYQFFDLPMPRELESIHGSMNVNDRFYLYLQFANSVCRICLPSRAFGSKTGP